MRNRRRAQQRMEDKFDKIGFADAPPVEEDTLVEEDLLEMPSVPAGYTKTMAFEDWVNERSRLSEQSSLNEQMRETMRPFATFDSENRAKRVQGAVRTGDRIRPARALPPAKLSLWRKITAFFRRLFS